MVGPIQSASFDFLLIFAKNTQDHQWYLSLTFDKCKMFLGAPQLLIMGEYLDSVNQNERVWGQPKKKLVK